MVTVASLDPEIASVGTALGLLVPVPGGHRLDDDFFVRPWNKVGGLVHDDVQRSALVDALEALLASSAPAVLPAVPRPPATGSAAGDGVRRCHPLLSPGGAGQLYLVVDRDGPSPEAAMRLGLAAEGQPFAGGPGVYAELTLLAAAAGTVTAVAGTPDHPLRIQAQAPLGSPAAGPVPTVAVAVQLVAPPHLDQSGIRVELHGLDDGPPLVLDPVTGGDAVATLAVGLVRLALDLLGPGVPVPVRAVADHLPGLLGIGGGLPPLPLGKLVSDPDTMRTWLAVLLTAVGDSGRPALLDWLDSVAGLLTAPAAPAVGLPGPADPYVIPLLTGPPDVAATVAVRTAPSGGGPELLVGLTAALPALPGLDAAVAVDAVLLTVPLSGTAATTVLERLDVTVAAPAGPGPLVPQPGEAAGAFRLDGLRAGLRYTPAAAVRPVLELDGVTIDLGGTTRTFDSLDLTDATALSAAAQQLLGDAIAAGLGVGTDTVTALRTVLGLGTNPGLDLAAFAGSPTRAMADYLRALRATAGGWPGLLEAVATLLGTAVGGAGGAAVAGDGSAARPWRLPLDRFPAPARASAELALLLWDDGTAAEPALRLGLALDAPAGAPGPPDGEWQVSARVQVVGVTLPAGRAGEVRWLDGVAVQARCVPGALPALPGGVTVSVGAVAVELGWVSGSGLALAAQLTGVTVDLDPVTIDLGDVTWPPPGGVDLTAADLGLGIDPAVLWSAVRPLLVHYAESAGGPAVRDLLALVGVVGPGSTGAARDLPPLDLGPGGLRDLLAAPLEAVRGWLAGLALDAAAAVPGGQPFIRDLLTAAQTVLTGRTPVLGASAAPEPDLPVQGSGTPDDPWTIPLHAPGEPAVELLGWLEPDGPPIEWALARLVGLDAGDRDGVGDEDTGAPPGDPASADVATPSGADLAAALSDVVGYLPAAGTVRSAGPGLVATALDTLADVLLAGDGVVDAADVVADRSGWRVADTLDAAHHLLPGAAAPAVLAEIGVRTAGLTDDEWAALLLAPAVAGPQPWAALLAGTADADVATVSLRTPGTPPEQADLGAVGPALWYDVDLGDDGTSAAAAALLALTRVVAAVRREKPGARVLLVAHSYLGLVAQAFVDAEPDSVLGLITLGTPADSRAGDYTDALVAEGARLVDGLAAGGLPGTDAIQDAVGLLVRLLDGQGNGKALLPLSAFTRFDPTALDLHGVPALAVAGQLLGDVRDGLAAALGLAVDTGAGGSLPTHLVWGVRVGLDVGPAKAGDPDVDVSVLAELGRVRLALGAPGPNRPAYLQVRAALTREGGWLVGGPGDGAPQEARIRAAELTATVVADPAGRTTTVDLRLHDVALRGVAATVVGLADPRAQELLDRLVTTLDVAEASGGRVDVLLAALADLGIVRRRTSSASAAVLADGFAGITADAAAWCAARLPALLDRDAGLLGLARAAGAPRGGGPWQLAHPRLPVEVVVSLAPWRVTVHTTDAGLPLGADATLMATGTVDLATVTPQTDAALLAGGIALVRDPAGGPALSGTWLDPPLRLTAATGPEVLDRLGPLLPRVLAAAGLGAALEGLVGVQVADLGLLLADPGRWVARILGDGTSRLPDATRLADLLRALAAEAGLDGGAAAPLALPGDLLVGVDPDGTGLRLSTRTATPVVLFTEGGHDATLALDLRLAVDAARHVTPGGDLTLHLPLPGEWGSLDIRVGADPSGASAQVDITVPQAGGAPATVTTVTLLPTVSGLENMAGAAAERLLPAVLDRLVSTVGARNPRPAILDEALAVADQLGIHDQAGGFSAKAAELAALADSLGTGAGAGAAVAGAIEVVLRRVLGAALIPAGAPGTVGVDVPLPFGGVLRVTADLRVAPPSVLVELSGLAAGPVGLALRAGYTHPVVVASADMSLRVDTQLGVVLSPAVHVEVLVDVVDPAQVALVTQLRPLGDGSVVVPLAPVPAPPAAADLLRIAEAWVIPLAGTLAVRAAAAVIETSIWSGGKTVADILVSAQAFDRAADGSLTMRPSLPTPGQLLHGALDALTGAAVPLPGGATLKLVSDGSLYGVVLSGEVVIPAGNLAVAVRFGLPPALDVGWGPAGQGVGLLLLDLTDPQAPQLLPVLRLGGLGVRVGAAAGKALLDTGGFRLGAAAAHVRTDIPLTGAAALRRPATLDGAIVLEGLGLPFGSGDNRSNPVAASLMRTDGSGDGAPVNPPLDVLVGRGGGRWTVQFSGKADIRFEIHRSFGPLHIEELAVLYVAATNGVDPGSVGLAVDGGVALAGLAVNVDDLTLLVPLKAPADLSKWTVDLAGLSVALAAGPVNVSGGLLKARLPDGTIDYEGQLSVDVAGRGFTAVGAYAQPDDALGSYTSMFVFVSVSIPIGGPPYLFILGFGGGAGYNRRLLVPRDPAGVPSFPLVSAINGGGAAADTGAMAALQNIGKEIPPARGAIWIAAGLKFSTFELLHTTAVAYVTIDHGLEVGLLGLMEMVLPADDAAVVSLQLGLAARYSTVDQILSIRAALTANSWLISKDCRLTGGFAFVVWFGRPDVLLSVGGYGPLFTPPDFYPQVPAVGFQWSVGGGIVVKGETYFTLTPAALMFGGRLEASYDVSPVRVWLTVHLDVLIIWDPFHYVLDAGVSVGASFTIKICFFACVRISVSVSLGANVHIEGPPLHATVTVDLAIARVTVEFGERRPQDFLDWDAASAKYLAGGAARPATTATVALGGRAPEGGAVPDGTEDRPFLVAPEFSVRIESVMPLHSWRVAGSTLAGSAGRAQVDVVPCGNKVGRVEAVLVVTVERRSGGTWVAVPAATASTLLPTTATSGFPVAVWDAAGAGRPGAGAPMITALSALTLATSVTITERTGTLGEIPFSRLVEEEAPRPLPFGPARTPPAWPAPPVARRARRAAAVPAPDPGLVRGPRLRAVVEARHLDGGLAARARATGGRLPADAGSLRVGRIPDGPARLPDGGALVWDVDVAARHRLDLARDAGRSLPLRVVGLTGTGAVVSDRVADGRSVLPTGASRVVATAAATGDPGWDVATPLLPAAPSTLLAVQATVRLARPWTPPARYARLGEHTPVPAAVVLAGQEGVVTDLPTDVRAVVVLLDRASPDAAPGDVVITLSGATADRRRSVVTGQRVRMVVPVRAVDPEARAVSVQVVTGPGWRLAGVQGRRGATATEVTRQLRAEPWQRIEPVAGRGAPVAIGLTSLPARPRRSGRNR